MTRGQAFAGALLKWLVVMAVGAGIGGYIVSTFRDGPAPLKIKPSEDLGEITPGSSSSAPTVASNAAKPSAPGASTSSDPRSGDDNGETKPLPEGITGPDVEITVKRLPPTGYGHHHRRRKHDETDSSKQTGEKKKPPAETFLPDAQNADPGPTAEGTDTESGGTDPGSGGGGTADPGSNGGGNGN